MSESNAIDNTTANNASNLGNDYDVLGSDRDAILVLVVHHIDDSGHKLACCSVSNRTGATGTLPTLRYGDAVPTFAPITGGCSLRVTGEFTSSRGLKYIFVSPVEPFELAENLNFFGMDSYLKMTPFSAVRGDAELINVLKEQPPINELKWADILTAMDTVVTVVHCDNITYCSYRGNLVKIGPLTESSARSIIEQRPGKRLNGFTLRKVRVHGAVSLAFKNIVISSSGLVGSSGATSETGQVVVEGTGEFDIDWDANHDVSNSKIISL